MDSGGGNPSNSSITIGDINVNFLDHYMKTGFGQTESISIRNNLFGKSSYGTGSYSDIY